MSMSMTPRSEVTDLRPPANLHLGFPPQVPRPVLPDSYSPQTSFSPTRSTARSTRTTVPSLLVYCHHPTPGAVPGTVDSCRPNPTMAPDHPRALRTLCLQDPPTRPSGFRSRRGVPDRTGTLSDEVTPSTVSFVKDSR